MTEGVQRMAEASQLFGFSLDDRTLAIPLTMVLRVFLSVQVTPLPASPDIIIGVISYHGTIVPVVDLRVRFNAPPKEIILSDRFILIQTKNRLLAIVASEVSGVLKYSGTVIPAEDILPGARYISGVLPEGGRLILIHDPDLFLSPGEEIALDITLESTSAGEVP